MDKQDEIKLLHQIEELKKDNIISRQNQTANTNKLGIVLNNKVTLLEQGAVEMRADVTSAKTDSLEAKNQAVEAQNMATDAQTEAQEAQNMASLVQVEVQTAQTRADNAYNLATTAKSTADNANTLGALAYTDAQTAKTNAQTATTKANTAQTTANEAKTAAVNAQNSINTMETRTTNLESRVEVLENVSPGQGGSTGEGDLAPVAYTGSYNDLLDRPDKDNPLMFSTSDTSVNFHGITQNSWSKTRETWFICSPDCIIEGTIKVTTKSQWSYISGNERLECKLNDETVIASTVYTSFDAILEVREVSFKFRPNKKQNYFTFSFVPSGMLNLSDFILLDYEISITKGKNIFFLNREFIWQAAVYQSNYLIMRNNAPTGKYTVTNKDNFNNFTLSNTNTFYGRKFTPFFRGTYSKAKAPVISNKGGYICDDHQREEYSSTIYHIGTSDDIWQFEAGSHGLHPTYFREKRSNYFPNFPAITGVFGSDGYLAFYEPGIAALEGQLVWPFTLNGVEVEKGCWLENVAVTTQDLTGVDYIGFKGSVAQRNDGECFFFPNYNADYILPLGLGRKVTAFYQSNTDINVYLGRINCVVKKVLRKNTTTNQYEVVSEEIIYGVEQYVETLDGKYIGINGYDIGLFDV